MASFVKKLAIAYGLGADRRPDNVVRLRRMAVSYEAGSSGTRTVGPFTLADRASQ